MLAFTQISAPENLPRHRVCGPLWEGRAMRRKCSVKTSCPICGGTNLYWWYIKSKKVGGPIEHGIHCSGCGKNFPNSEEKGKRGFENFTMKNVVVAPMSSARVGEISFLVMMLTLEQRNIHNLEPTRIAELIGITTEEFLSYMNVLSSSAKKQR